MTTPTYEELKVQRAAIDAQMAATELNMVNEAAGILQANPSAAGWDRIGEICSSISPCEAKTQLSNLLIVWNANKQTLAREGLRLAALIPPA